MSAEPPPYFLQLCCDACRYPLTSIVYQCTECASIYLCHNCFSLGASFSNHSREHECLRGAVQSPEGLRVPEEVVESFGPPMGVNELILFLKLIGEFGFNWPKVAEQMPFVGRMKPFAAVNCEKMYFAVLHVLRRRPALLFPSLPRPETVVPSGPANYSQLRDEFEHDWLPETEVFIAEAAASEASELLRLLHAYNRVLDERQLRKRFIVDSGLTAGPAKKRRAMLDKLRIFARPAALLGPGTLEALATNLAEEERLREAVARGTEIRKVGAKSERDFAIYETQIIDRNEDVCVYLGEELAEISTSEEKDLCDKVGVAWQHCAVVKRLFQVVKPIHVEEAKELVNPNIIGALWKAQNKVRKPININERNELLNIFTQGIMNILKLPSQF